MRAFGAVGWPAAAQPAASPDIVVVGAGTFGLWTALHLRRLGARVTVVDAYGAGNSRQTSGGETRGVRTSYGDRPHGRQWAGWARRAIERWVAWDEEGRDRLLPRLFFQTGDLILRDEVRAAPDGRRCPRTIAGSASAPAAVRPRTPIGRTAGSRRSSTTGLARSSGGISRL